MPSAEDLEPVAQAEADSLGDGAREVRATVREGKAHEGAARGSVAVRRSLALQIRQEREPEGAGRDARRLAIELELGVLAVAPDRARARA